jgi:hypothetical protein
MLENDDNTDDLQKYIQKWVAVDNQLQLLNEKSKKMREWKKKLTENISEKLQKKGWEHRILEIPDGELKLQEKTEYSTLSFGYIEECLHELIPEEEQVDFVMNYLREHREVKTIMDIRRKKNIVSK